MTSLSSRTSSLFGSTLLAAALALPSVQFAYADTPPERSVVSFKYLNFKDSRSNYIDPTAAPNTGGGDDGRSGASGGGGIQAYTFRGVVPFAQVWSVGTSFTYDSVSGASPTYHTSGLTPMKDSRKAVDVQLTRYFSHANVVLGTSYSGESDYVSRNFSLQGSLETADKNTTFTVGGSLTDDTTDLINLTKTVPGTNPSNPFAQKVVPVKTGFTDTKKIVAGLVGVTRVLTTSDIVQLNVGYSQGSGYYSDPYKFVDNRPRERKSTTALARWNHHFKESFTDGTARLSYRYYRDTFGIKAHTFDVEYVHPLPGDWSVMPLIRYYSQNAADFYVPVNLSIESTTPGVITETPQPAGAVYYTEDQRLAAFGALTFGVKVTKKIDEDWSADVKFEYYEQRTGWSLSSGKDSALEPYSATSIQVGVSRAF